MRGRVTNPVKILKDEAFEVINLSGRGDAHLTTTCEDRPGVNVFELAYRTVPSPDIVDSINSHPQVPRDAEDLDPME